jgi:hypothetical protein
MIRAEELVIDQPIKSSDKLQVYEFPIYLLKSYCDVKYAEYLHETERG